MHSVSVSAYLRAPVETSARRDKSMLLAHTLWFFLGAAGAHRFYLGQHETGALMLALCVVALTVPGWTGLALLFAPFAWASLDLFRLPALVRARNAQQRGSAG